MTDSIDRWAEAFIKFAKAARIAGSEIQKFIVGYRRAMLYSRLYWTTGLPRWLAEFLSAHWPKRWLPKLEG